MDRVNTPCRVEDVDAVWILPCYRLRLSSDHWIKISSNKDCLLIVDSSRPRLSNNKSYS